MEWIESLNRALRFIEDRLTDETLTVEEVARATAYSPFYLQRLFYVLTDLSLADYIRQRRLSAAGQELQSRGVKVLDTALRYGYETPESFCKAFRRFHGITPSAAQRTRVQLRYLNPLQIKVELTGGGIMDYTLETMGELTVLGMERPFTYENNLTGIPKFWSEYLARGWCETVPGMLGVCFDEQNGPTFAYLIGSFGKPDAPVPEGFVKRVIAPHTWAKFRAVGPMPGSIQKVTKQIYTEWLPNNTEFEPAEGVSIEMYTEGDLNAADYESEVWVPLRRKG